MAVLITAEVPGQTKEGYEGVLAAVGPLLRAAKGFIAHGAGPVRRARLPVVRGLGNAGRCDAVLREVYSSESAGRHQAEAVDSGTAHPDQDLVDVKDQQKKHWNAVAGGWAAWFDWTNRNFRPVADWFRDAAGWKPGARILDVALRLGLSGARGRGIRPPGRHRRRHRHLAGDARRGFVARESRRPRQHSSSSRWTRSN